MTSKEAVELKQGDAIYFVKPYHEKCIYLYDVIPVIYVGGNEGFEKVTVKYTDKDICIPAYIGSIYKTEKEGWEDAAERTQESIITEEKHIKNHRENIEILNNALAEYELKKSNFEVSAKLPKNKYQLNTRKIDVYKDIISKYKL